MTFKEIANRLELRGSKLA